MEKTLSLELVFYYKSDEDAIKGKEELKRIFRRDTNEFDGMIFNRIHNKVRGGRYYDLRRCSDNIISAYLIKITEILERFEKKFPTKWRTFYMTTSIMDRKDI